MSITAVARIQTIYDMAFKKLMRRKEVLACVAGRYIGEFRGMRPEGSVLQGRHVRGHGGGPGRTKVIVFVPDAYDVPYKGVAGLFSLYLRSAGLGWKWRCTGCPRKNGPDT
ncbi:MAG: hypothetical protein SPF89_09250 [Sphaerochaetaceae bacterium]|nr:hypothetical protein [Spirochaetales bacterium]MDY5500278.1 hypothetical protein [Sphaerochaetaceae bacterium]